MKSEVFINTNDKCRLDKFLADSIPYYSRAMVKEAIEQGKVKVNGLNILSPKHKLCIDDECEIEITERKIAKGIKELDLEIEIIFEDEHLAIVNKPAGLTTHPGAGNNSNTLMNALYKQLDGKLSNVAGKDKLGIVHRLDKETSGVMVVAKTNECHLLLSEMLQKHTIQRIYRAFVYGIPKLPFGKIETYVAKDKNNRLRMQVRDVSGVKAVTHYSLVETFYDTYSLMEFELETGRTHQIRVHMEHLKTPIIGDKVYGKRQNFSLRKLPEDIMQNIKKFHRHALHSYKINFMHPITGGEITRICEMPEDILRLC